MNADSPGVLDEAWAAAEAALPEGWRLDTLSQSPDGWFALAVSANGDEFTDSEYTDTPAAALHALAAALAPDKETPDERR